MQFRRSLRALHEDNRYFDDAQAPLDRFPCHFHLKGVAAGLQCLERQRQQRLPSPAAIACGRILDAKAGDNPDVEIGEAAQHPAVERPVRDAAPWHVARSDHQIGGCRRGNHGRQVSHIVRQVRVHLRDEVGVGGQCALHAFDVR